MRAGLRRLVAAWSTFGILLAVDVVTTVTNKHSSPTHSLLDCGGLGAFTWALLESFCGPWAKGRQAQPDNSRRTAEVVAEYVAAQIRAAEDDDGDGAVSRKCG